MTRWMKITALLATLGLLCLQQAPIAVANPPVDIHCVGVMVLDNVVTEEGPEQDGPEDPAFEVADPVPAEEEICVHDENLAWTISGQSGKRLVKVWTETGFNGSSKVYTTGTLAGNDNHNDGCADGDDFKKGSFGALNNDIESAKGFNSCSYMFIFDYKHFKGNWWGRALDDGDLGAAKNENGSIAVDNPE